MCMLDSETMIVERKKHNPTSLQYTHLVLHSVPTDVERESRVPHDIVIKKGKHDQLGVKSPDIARISSDR